MLAYVTHWVGIFTILDPHHSITNKWDGWDVFIWFVWFLSFVSFIWLNQTNQINQRNQSNQRNQAVFTRLEFRSSEAIASRRPSPSPPRETQPVAEARLNRTDRTVP